MSHIIPIQPLERIPSGIEGFDHISMGGLVKGRTTLVVGTSGTGKTIFSMETAYRAMEQHGINAVYVTFEERPEDLLRNVMSLGWSFTDALESSQFTIIDASLDQSMMQETGAYDLSGIIAQIQDAVARTKSELVILDSTGSLFLQYSDATMIRREIVRIRDMLSGMGITVLFTAERLEEHGPISRHGIEEFVSDCVIVLRHVLENEKVRRTIQIYKLRGCPHHEGEFPMMISSRGLTILPLSALGLHEKSTNRRIRFGNETIDRMSGGGMFQDSVILVSGPTGSGKTLMCTTFAAQSCKSEEKTLYFGFEESRPQLTRNASSWGMDFEKWEAEGLLRIVCKYPDAQGLAQHLIDIREEINEFQPTRVVIDSISAMERVASHRTFREFVIGLTSLVKQRQICMICTSTSPKLSGGDSVTDVHISTITDSIILLRYVEIAGALRRGAVVIKMRGSQHDKEVREFTVNEHGLQMGEPLREIPHLVFGRDSHSPLDI